MSDIFFSDLQIPVPDQMLQPKANGHPDQFIADTTVKLQDLLLTMPGALAIVYGDTNTTFAAALASRRTGTTLFHFEAGIRTGDESMPEEVNRILTDRLAGTNYCCTAKNYQVMLSEGYGSSIGSRVIQTGDLMYDAFLKIPSDENDLIPEKEYIACTIHRAANILRKEKLAAIIEALNNIHREIPVVMPLHPHTQRRMMEYGLRSTFITLPPLGYPAMKSLLKHSTYIITDSGGAAREAFFSGKKSIVVMDKPFWPEILEAGCSIASRAATQDIIHSYRQLPSLPSNFQNPIFGTGNAAAIIAQDLLQFV